MLALEELFVSENPFMHKTFNSGCFITLVLFAGAIREKHFDLNALMMVECLYLTCARWPAYEQALLRQSLSADDFEVD